MTEQDILDYINEYVSYNHVPMIRGTHFDWEKVDYHDKRPIWNRCVYLGGRSMSGDIFEAWYLKEKKILDIVGVKIYCETPADAELIVLAYLKANDKELGHLYTREHIKPG